MQRPDPFLIPKIVQTVLGYLSKEELKKFRLVSNLWNEECCKLLQTIEKISFSNASKVANYTEIFTKTSSQFPHARYHLSKLKMNLIFDNYVLRKFFRIFGNRIECLYLDFYGSWFRMKFFRMGILESLSNLKTLYITFKDSHELWPGAMNDDHEILPLWTLTKLVLIGTNTHISWKEPLIKILASLPNLQSIEAGNGLGKMIFEILFNTSNNNNFVLPHPTLTTLILDNINANLIDSIKRVGLRLQRFEADFEETVDQSQIRSLLEYLAPTLTDIRIGSKNPALIFPEPPKVMGSLTNLEIRKFTCDLSIFRNKFPVLIKLKFKRAQIICENKLNLSSSSYRLPVNSLILDCCEGLFSSIPLFGKMFPRLRSLDIPETGLESQLLQDSNYNLLGLICESMSDLEELRLSYDAINDEIVTGIPTNIARDVLERIQFGVNNQNSFDPKMFRKNATWIGNLQRLRSLDLRCVDLSDFGVIYGIACCTRLEKLTLHSPYWMTNLSLKAIGDKLTENLVALDIFCSNQVTQSAVTKLKNKMKGRKCLISENKFSLDDDSSIEMRTNAYY